MSNIGKRRMDTDIVKLVNNNHHVQLVNNLNEFIVKFHGPKNTHYEGGVWKIRVELPDKYPFKSPSIGFINKIYHPNIDEASGTVCLDVINQAWTALYDLANIFESFLPQLLTYPNAQDPLNGEAASLYIHKPQEYERKCKDYVQRFASEAVLFPPPAAESSGANGSGKEAEEADEDAESVSSLSEYESDGTFEEEYANFKGLDEDDDKITVNRMQM
ncbi:unnamed protein product [Caenorhabditis sp. 36 PRJEB53466]|nr:unnamed protein product [Caenorhabditis sp. 36 PRJEB53466]